VPEALEELYRGALTAIDELRLDAARAAIRQATELAGTNAIEVLHLRGMLAWASGEREAASGFLMQAADEGINRPEVYLDCAELEMELGELDEAEAVLRVLLDLPGVPPEKADEARILLAHVRRADDDPEEGLSVLAEVRSSLRTHPYFHSVRASVLLELDRAPEAVAELAAALEAVPGDADLQWEMGIAAHAAGDEEKARAAMLRTWELDAAERETAPLSTVEVDALRSGLEAVMEELPELVLQRLAGAPIAVEDAATREQVAAGADPRNPVLFEGTVDEGAQDPTLTRIVVLRGPLLEAVEDEEDLPEALFFALMAELRRFFGLERLTVVDAEA
jgi:Flp pilus assembly protein TadD